MPKSYLWTTALLTTVLIAGCKKPADESSSNPPQKPAIADTVTDKWLGKWIGPEGTYLVLSKNAEKYAVKSIRSTVQRPTMACLPAIASNSSAMAKPNTSTLATAATLA